MKLYILFIIIILQSTILLTYPVLAEEASTDSATTLIPSTPPAAEKADTLNVVTSQGEVKKIVKRNFNPHEQVVTGAIIMTFIIVIITTVGNWNP